MASVELEFFKSTYSGNRQDCVEVAKHPAVGAAVRDTQNRELGHLEFEPGQFVAFLADVKAGNL